VSCVHVTCTRVSCVHVTCTRVSCVHVTCTRVSCVHVHTPFENGRADGRTGGRALDMCMSFEKINQRQQSLDAHLESSIVSLHSTLRAHVSWSILTFSPIRPCSAAVRLELGLQSTTTKRTLLLVYHVILCAMSDDATL